MKLASSALSVVAVAACGSVKDVVDAPPAVDTITCGGTMMNGECVCPPRHVAPECTTCAPGWGGADCSMFTDNFNRAAGALGTGYADLVVPLADDALVVNNRACGDVQSVAILDELVDAPGLSARFTIDTGNNNGQEFSFLITSDPDLASLGGIFLAGCDGGGGTCRLRIAPANGNALAARQLTQAIPAGSQVAFSVDGSQNIQVEITINGTPERVTAQLPVGYRVQRLGFIVGREQDGTLTCLDDFAVTIN